MILRIILAFFVVFFSCVEAHTRPFNVTNEQGPHDRSILRKKAPHVTFPLSQEDLNILKELEEIFDKTENCAGLAANQIGYHKPFIVFAAEDKDGTLKKYRQDFSDSMPKTIWINPTYEPISHDKNEDYEGCFSVYDLAGPVKRYKTIRYRAQLPDGTYVQGIARGFLARVIQHEVDHTRGVLCMDLVPSGKLMSIKDYRARRAKMITKKENEKQKDKQ